MIKEFRLPNITAVNDSGKLTQMQSYLYQLVEQLNWAMKNVGSADMSASTSAGQSTNTNAQQSVAEAQATFNSIKSLIVKSAEIVNAYYDKISARLEGVYVAESDFGIYAEQTSQEIKANADGILQNFEKVTKIDADINFINNNLAYIKTGWLYDKDDGTPVSGLEIGQRTEENKQEIFKAYARFTPDKLSFHDSNGLEVAYISDRKLYIKIFEATENFVEGGFEDTIMDDGSVVTKWVGKGG